MCIRLHLTGLWYMFAQAFNSLCINPAPLTPSFLSWLGLSSLVTQGVLCIPFVLEEKQSAKLYWPLTCGLFLLYLACSLMVGPYANSSEVSQNSGGVVYCQ